MKMAKSKSRSNVFTRNRYSWYAALITALIMLFSYAVWEFFPFGDNIILRMDLYHQYAPLMAELYERVFGGHTLLYSFTSGLGSSFIGNYFNYLSSPTMLLVMIFGHFNIPEAVAAMVLVKSAAAAYTFTYFLRKISGKTELPGVAFGILYAFCGYFVAYYWNVMWTDAMVVFPLVLLGIYQIIEQRRCLTYILSLAYIMLINYYMAYMVCILSVLFFLYFYFSKYPISERNITGIKLKKKKGTFLEGCFNSKFITCGASFAASSVMAALIGAVALIPVAFILQDSSATSSASPTEFSTYFTIFDFLANHLAGVEPTIRSSGDTVYPNVYCGIATLMLVPLFMFSKKISLREKVASCLVLGVFFFCFNINFLNFIMHGLHFPNDLPYRFSFAYSCFLIFLAYRAFTQLDRLTGKEILLSAFGVGAFAMLCEKIGSANVDMSVVWTSVIFAGVYAVVLVMFRHEKVARSSVAILLVTAVCAEVMISDIGNYKVTQTKPSYTDSYADTEEALDYIRQTEGEDGFYRTELSLLLTRMDNCWFFYDGVSTFSSMAYETVSNLQDYLGMYGNRINSYTYHDQTALYNAMMSLKYVVDNHTYVPTDNYVPQLAGNDLYTKVHEYNEMTVYRNNYWLPVAFGVSDKTDTDWYYNGTNPLLVQEEFFKLASGVDGLFIPLEGKAGDFTNVTPVTDEKLNSGAFNIEKTDAGSVNGEAEFVFHTDREMPVYMFVDGGNLGGAVVTTDVMTYSQSLDESYILDLGVLPADTDVTVSINLEEDKSNSDVRLNVYGLDKEKFISAYNAIIEGGALNVTENREHYLKGDITLAQGKMLYTSIPYDAGWTVRVDGAAVSSDNIVKIGNALMGVKMQPGSHTVEFSFMPRGLSAGVMMTVIGICLLILLEILKKKRLLMFSEKFRQDYVFLGKWRDFDAEAGITETEPAGTITEFDEGEFPADEFAAEGETPPEQDIPAQQAIADEEPADAPAEEAAEPAEAEAEIVLDDEPDSVTDDPEDMGFDIDSDSLPDPVTDEELDKFEQFALGADIDNADGDGAPEDTGPEFSKVVIPDGDYDDVDDVLASGERYGGGGMSPAAKGRLIAIIAAVILVASVIAGVAVSRRNKTKENASGAAGTTRHVAESFAGAEVTAAELESVTGVRKEEKPSGENEEPSSDAAATTEKASTTAASTTTASTTAASTTAASTTAAPTTAAPTTRPVTTTAAPTTRPVTTTAAPTTRETTTAAPVEIAVYAEQYVATDADQSYYWILRHYFHIPNPTEAMVNRLLEANGRTANDVIRTGDKFWIPVF